MTTWIHDPLRDRWVIRAPDRRHRPDRVRNHAAVEGCPFCPGNEDATPPELDRAEGPDGWTVRVFENLYPAVRSGDGPPRGLVDGATVTGAHEVIVTTPRHTATFADLDDAAATAAFGMLLRRVAHHRRSGRAHAQGFINHGAAAGASIEHPHAQLVALDVVPPRIRSERSLLRAQGCPLCRLDPAFDVVHRGGVRVAVPPWAAAPFESLLLPVGHGRPLTPGMGPVLRDLLAAIRQATGDVAYNVELHPGRGHSHVHIDPRTTAPGGLERGTGIYVSPMSPQETVEQLRDALDAG